MTLGGYKKETAQMILEVVRYLKDSGYVIERPSRGMQTTVPPDAPIYIRNDSDEEIPAFGCVQTTGTVDFGGQNYITVDKPSDTSGASGKYLFNSIAPVAVDDYGIAYSGPLVRVLTDGSTVTCGAQWQPVVDSFALAPGGTLFTAAGLDDIEDDVMRAFVNSGGGIRLYRFTLNASLASGTADADILEMSGSDTGLDEDVLDPLGIFASLTAVGSPGLCLLQDGAYYVIQAPCP